MTTNEMTATAGDATQRTLQSKDLLMRVHNGRVGGDWSPEDIVGIGEVYDDDLVGLVDLFPDTNEVVGL